MTRDTSRGGGILRRQLLRWQRPRSLRLTLRGSKLFVIFQTPTQTTGLFIMLGARWCAAFELSAQSTHMTIYCLQDQHCLMRRYIFYLGKEFQALPKQACTIDVDLFLILGLAPNWQVEGCSVVVPFKLVTEQPTARLARRPLLLRLEMG